MGGTEAWKYLKEKYANKLSSICYADDKEAVKELNAWQTLEFAAASYDALRILGAISTKTT